MRDLLKPRIGLTLTLVAFSLVSSVALADTVNAIYNSATDVPVTASGYTATGNTVNFTLNFAPATGTDLMVVKTTNLAFIGGRFDNLSQGQPVALSYGGVTYRFVANYYGGSGNDLVLAWASNRAFAWGSNSDGQLGDNTMDYHPQPAPVTSTGVLAGETVVAVVAGTWHSLALCLDGTVAAWGFNAYGQLGDNTSVWRSTIPVAVSSASGISALYGKTPVAVAAGGHHSLALCSDGTVAGWGSSQFGQLGDNSKTIRRAPVAANTNAGVSALYGKTVVAIAAGAYHSLVLCSDGTVAAWGLNSNGQLGDDTATERLVPVAVNTAPGVSALYGKTVVAIAAGGWHSLALCSDGTAAAWGSNQSGQLGDNTTTQRPVPVAVNTASDVSALYGKSAVAVAAGSGHSLALCSDGTVAAWGHNGYGQLGDNSTGTNRLVPVEVNRTPGVSVLFSNTVTAIAAGGNHSLAQCGNGTLAAWGDNDFAQLGDGTTTQRNVPVAVSTTVLTASQQFTRVASGLANHTLGLVAAPPASEVALTGAQTLANGSFQFTYTNTPGAFFGVLAATNPALPPSNWTPLTGLTEVTPGQFQFADPQATNTLRRFYRVRSP